MPIASANTPPNLVIAQEHCEVCAVTPGDVARSGCDLGGVRVLALSASTVEGVFEGILQVAQALGREAEGHGLVRRERARLDVVRARTAVRRGPSVVMLEWTDPIFAMANWGPELVEIANGELLPGKSGEYSSAIPGEWVAEADPEYLIVAPGGYPLARAEQERAVLEAYPWWNGLRAVREGKVVFADGNRFFNRSGMTVTQTAEILAEILHGETFGEPAEGLYWRRYIRDSEVQLQA
ncbi:MAG TPA: ABC transporter substrate-binding protein [Verrucomicrobiae bacterium]|nr:ABC transporter substrate-binding protein [Verrucomicrobiae bacterium]